MNIQTTAFELIVNTNIWFLQLNNLGRKEPHFFSMHYIFDANIVVGGPLTARTAMMISINDWASMPVTLNRSLIIRYSPLLSVFQSLSYLYASKTGFLMLLWTVPPWCSFKKILQLRGMPGTMQISHTIVAWHAQESSHLWFHSNWHDGMFWVHPCTILMPPLHQCKELWHNSQIPFYHQFDFHWSWLSTSSFEHILFWLSVTAYFQLLWAQRR